MKGLQFCMDKMNVIFKLTNSPSFMYLFFSKQFQVLRTVKIHSHWFEWVNVIFKLATLDELDNAGNFNQSIWAWLIILF